MDYYDTTPEQVEAAAASLGISQQLAHALLERGHSEAEIAAMPPRKRFREFCQWKDLIDWGETLLCIAVESGALVEPKSARQDSNQG